ncbi:MAG TPA: hypothetical protein VNN10_01815 [Dehalococcoidia bacterium]|nr:hypothetical protein [Dehalococcoidia bacterium]
MAIDTSTEIIEKNGVLVGPLRRPRNSGRAGEGSIHHDETAQKVGFRGGTIAGSVHMGQFPPLLLRAFGQRWFETGTLSCYFKNATISDEAVRCFVQVPPAGAADAQVRVWMERDDGMQVLEGTASVGSPKERTLLRERLEEHLPERGETRIYAHLEPGMELPAQKTRVEPLSEERLSLLTEPLSWYTGASPWGGPIAGPQQVVGAMRRVEQGIGHRNRGVGLFGAIEVRYINGPVFIGRDYDVAAKVLAVGETPRSEYWWYESIMSEPDSGKEVAAMIMMLRMMKASSELWQ